MASSQIDILVNLEREFWQSQNIAIAGNPRHPRPRMCVLAHSWATSLALRLNSLLIYSPAIRGGSAPPARLQIAEVDTRR